MILVNNNFEARVSQMISGLVINYMLHLGMTVRSGVESLQSLKYNFRLQENSLFGYQRTSYFR